MLQGWIIGLSFVTGAIVLGYGPAQLSRKHFGPVCNPSAGHLKLARSSQ
jgi:hypothetical protein